MESTWELAVVLVDLDCGKVVVLFFEFEHSLGVQLGHIASIC